MNLGNQQMKMTSRGYDFYEQDGAYFRARAEVENRYVEEVWTPNGWEPYRGDGLKPVVYGNHISSTELPNEARKAATIASDPSRLPKLPTEWDPKDLASFDEARTQMRHLFEEAWRKSQ